jgi:hypothetical protein
MWHLLKRHPMAVRAWFEFVLVLTYALPPPLLRPLLPPGLRLDTYGGCGFLAIAMVRARGLRPGFVPAPFGLDFFLVGYRVFVRYRTAAGRDLRGLYILRSDADRRVLVLLGGWLTHYGYRRAAARWDRAGDTLEVVVKTRGGEGDLHVRADLAGPVATPPAGSPFPDLQAARRYAGPLPFTFAYEPETRGILRVEGVRENWAPRPVAVEVRDVGFLRRPPLVGGPAPRLAAAFALRDVPYRWKPGVLEALPPAGAPA